MNARLSAGSRAAGQIASNSPIIARRRLGHASPHALGSRAHGLPRSVCPGRGPGPPRPTHGPGSILQPPVVQPPVVRGPLVRSPVVRGRFQAPRGRALVRAALGHALGAAAPGPARSARMGARSARMGAWPARMGAWRARMVVRPAAARPAVRRARLGAAAEPAAGHPDVGRAADPAFRRPARAPDATVRLRPTAPPQDLRPGVSPPHLPAATRFRARSAVPGGLTIIVREPAFVPRW
jgi:hypothetical protein